MIARNLFSADGLATERRRVGKPDAASEWGLVLWGRSKAKPDSILCSNSQRSVSAFPGRLWCK
jgi:hypothetical protein